MYTSLTTYNMCIAYVYSMDMNVYIFHIQAPTFSCEDDALFPLNQWICLLKLLVFTIQHILFKKNYSYYNIHRQPKTQKQKRLETLAYCAFEV